MMIQTTPVDLLMRALGDPTRRAVFERIARSGEITVGELTQGSGVTQGAISQHVKSLKQAGLIAERPEGRNVYYRAQPHGLSPLTEWIQTYERFWTSRLDRLESLLLAEDAAAAASKPMSKPIKTKSIKTKSIKTKKTGDDR